MFFLTHILTHTKKFMTTCVEFMVFLGVVDPLLRNPGLLLPVTFSVIYENWISARKK